MSESKEPAMSNWTQTYLRHLGLDVQPASFAYLGHLCRAHLQAFPFENVSKLIQAEKSDVPSIPAPDLFLQAAQEFHFGGTCYTLHTHFLQLLQNLGFVAHLVLVGTAHAGIIVRLPELNHEPLYVDVGSAAPLFRPVRFFTEPDNSSPFGSEAIRIAPDRQQPGRYRYQRYRGGELVSDSWHFHPDERREPADFSPEIVRSFHPDSTFLTCLRIHRYQLDRARCVSLKNNSLLIMHVDGREEKRILESVKEIEDAVANDLGLPRMPVGHAVEALTRRGIDIFSENA
ncbi:arylamine N-acetyltransferase [Brevibacillus ruminantium]|uniref:Arylamine N-acetyltransferase n=1 Tax=Brevibacillus ruminantium TaxID=2950604 RepID=A0ABY4WBM5_9BACL|nr:arylamine N-acetyltransferase [Brevibacillus ruminantium]USG64575.1 arylamine N-acetyltransferase [Brevibacillus ruminantium]